MPGEEVGGHRFASIRTRETAVATHRELRPRRNMIDIVVAILEAASCGATRTHLVYKSNLNFLLIRKYIRLLEAKGLLEVLPSTNEGNRGPVYKTSDKGTEALAALQNALGLVFEEDATT